MMLATLLYNVLCVFEEPIFLDLCSPTLAKSMCLLFQPFKFRLFFKFDSAQLSLGSRAFERLILSRNRWNYNTKEMCPDSDSSTNNSELGDSVTTSSACIPSENEVCVHMCPGLLSKKMKQRRKGRVVCDDDYKPNVYERLKTQLQKETTMVNRLANLNKKLTYA